MINNRSVTGIILAAGNSTRYGKNMNKNFEIINDIPIITYSLNIFNKNIYIDNILIAIKEEEIPLIENILKNNIYDKDINIVIGGNTRQESVYNCIRKTNSNIVIIHDGARPLIQDDYINKCLEAMDYYKGATVGVKSKDTVKITNDDNIVINTTIRCNTWIIQTPQCFDRKILLNAHEKYQNQNFTDDCYLLEKDGYNIKVLESDYSNIKITTSNDLDIIKKLVRKK